MPSIFLQVITILKLSALLRYVRNPPFIFQCFCLHIWMPLPTVWQYENHVIMIYCSIMLLSIRLIYLNCLIDCCFKIQKKYLPENISSYIFLYFFNQGSHQSLATLEHGSGMFGRFRFSQNKSASQIGDVLGCRTIDLHTSTIKIDAEQSDLLFCFRIISPLKTYTLQVMPCKWL